MSRLIYEGNTVERFGKTIPTPFIEKIKIYEDEIEADISIYLHITDDDTINQSIYDDLSNLRLYAGFGIISQQPDRLSLGTNFILVNDNIYNNEGKRFAKFMFSRNSSTRELQDFPMSRAISDSSNRETYYSCFIAISNDEDGAINRDLHSLNQPSEFDRRGVYGVLRNVSSPLIYEKVFTAPRRGRAPGEGGMANRLATDPITIYTDTSNVPYESIPLKSIQKNYHKTTDSFRQQIKTQLDALVNNFSNTSDQQVQSFRDSISFMTQTENGSADFLTTLDSVRNSFPSRTSTSELGLLYNAFKNIIFAANDALILEERVTRKIVPNTKLIDLRGINARIVSRGGLSWERRNESTYEPRVDEAGEVLYPNVFMERQQREVSKQETAINLMDKAIGPVTLGDPGTGLIEPNFDITSIFGYFFFDYEKSLHKKSNISQIFEVQKLLNIWGNNVLDSFFKFSKTEMLKFERFKPSEDPGAGRQLVRKITTPYENNRPISHLLTDNSTSETFTKIVSQTTDENEDMVTTTEIHYVIPRGFDTAEGLNGYRLMAFEFQDFEEASVSFKRGSSYRFNIFIDDNTLDFYDELVKNYEQTLTEIKRYLAQAEDFCSFNNIDNRFNDFFVEGVKTQYNDVDDYPWLKAPKLFAIHLDLITDLFSGFPIRMAEFASNLTALISPENGTLLSLQDFVNQMEIFYEEHYGFEGDITKLISSRRDPDGNVTPSLKDNIEFIATLGFDDLPDVLDFTVDIEPPPKMKLWNGGQVFLQKNPIKFFINSRTATLAMARSKNDSYKEFIEREQEKNNGPALVRLEALDAVFEKGALQAILANVAGAGGAALLGATQAAGAALGALGGATTGTAFGIATGGSATISTGGIVGSATVGLGSGTASAAGAAGAAAAAGAVGVAGIVIGGAALVALIVAMIISSSKRNRVIRIVKFINKFVARLQDDARPLTYEAKKSLVNRELNFAFGDSDSRPQPYKDLKNKDIEFLKGERERIGNIGLLTIGSTVQGVYDVSNWLSRKTKNVRDA